MVTRSATLVVRATKLATRCDRRALHIAKLAVSLASVANPGEKLHGSLTNVRAGVVTPRERVSSRVLRAATDAVRSASVALRRRVRAPSVATVVSCRAKRDQSVSRVALRVRTLASSIVGFAPHGVSHAIVLRSRSSGADPRA